MRVSPAAMTEATRLTREGRLPEAMALLQGGALPPGGDPGGVPGGPRGFPGPLIDMRPPAGSGGAWTAPPLGEPEGPGGIMERLGPLMARGLAGGLPGRLGGGLPGGLPGGMPGLRAGAVAVPDGALWEERASSGPAGSRAYKLYVPAAHAGRPLPLVVMLHGCTQSPDDFAAGTGMNAVAEEEGFMVAYPAQTGAANAQRCWNWFDGAHQGRGGEPAIVAGIARAVVADEGGDGARVYAAGLSAGGAAAAVLGAAFPDLFAAVGVHSGLACGAARDLPSALAAMRGGAAAAGVRPVPTIVFHGDRDGTVHPANGDAVAEAAGAATLGAPEVTRGRSPGGMAFTRTVHRDEGGRAMLERWLLHGAGHAWSGGHAAGSYTDPSGPDASCAMARFFRGHATGRGPRRG